MKTGFSPVKILIADDHTLFRRGLSLVLSKMYDQVEIAEASEVDAALAELERGGCDLILLDITMPGMENLRGLDELRRRFPKVPVVILSAAGDTETIRNAIERGARGYVLKSSSDTALKHALSLALAGETYIPSSALMAGSRRGFSSEAAQRFPEDNPLSGLTERQLDVLTLLMRGLPNKEIARSLGLLESTVKAHVKVILDKLAASNRTQAAMIAAELGWPPDPQPPG